MAAIDGEMKIREMKLLWKLEDYIEEDGHHLPDVIFHKLYNFKWQVMSIYVSSIKISSEKLTKLLFVHVNKSGSQWLTCI